MSNKFLSDEEIIAMVNIPLAIPLDSDDELDISDDEFDSEDNPISKTPIVRLSDLTPLLAYIPPTSESELLAPVSVPNLEKCDDYQSELLVTCEPSTSTQPAILNEPCVGNRKGTKHKLPATEQPLPNHQVL